MSSTQEIIRRNIQRLEEQVQAACHAAGRDRREVTIVAVTKYVDWPLAQEVVNAGLSVLGESRPQELWRKAEHLATSDVQWHLIGHLQTNKLKRTLPLVSMIHSIDSLALLSATNHSAATLQLTIPVLLEVNISGEQQKHGFRPENVARALELATELPHVCVQGLMGMAGLDSTDDQVLAQFSSLQIVRDQLRGQAPDHLDLPHLSMGMSRDFRLAIQAGATLVRVGSAIFEGLAIAPEA